MKLTDIEIKSLVQEFDGSTERRKNQILQLLFNHFLPFVNRRTKYISQELANTEDDLRQTVFIKLWKLLESNKIDINQNPVNYITEALKNVVKQYNQSQYNENKILVHNLAEDIVPALPPLYDRDIPEKYLNGHSIAELSRLCGKSQNTVKVILIANNVPLRSKNEVYELLSKKTKGRPLTEGHKKKIQRTQQRKLGLKKEEIDLIRTYRKEGQSLHWIAAKLGYNYLTIFNYTKKYNIPKPSRGQLLAPEIKNYLDRGLSGRQIAIRLNLSPALINFYIRKYL